MFLFLFILYYFSISEYTTKKAIFEQWELDDSCFISTKACKEVEKIIKSRNLVIVAGHSGSGKSAIIQHIALKYRMQGWTIRQVTNVKEIVNEYSSSRFQNNKTMLVFNDPFGKETFDELLNNSWQTYEEDLQLYLKTSKLIMSCRNHIISDTRVIRNLVNQSHIVNIDYNKYKLSVDEKRQILNKYTSGINLSDKDCDKVVEVERYFPLLCKLYSSKEEYKHKGIEFFTKPVTVLKEEILEFRKKDKGKYCALALLVLFNDDLCVSDLLTNEDNENKFKHMLKLCGLDKTTPPSAIGDNFSSMKDCFVKKIGDTYHFYHDLVMEVTTNVFGTDYPAETIKHADIGFIRKRVKLGNCDEHGDSFTIYLSGDRYAEELGERLYTELYGERLVDVVLNPCLRNEKVIEVLKKKIAGHPENHYLLLERKKLTIDKQKLDWTSKTVLMNKLKFLELENEVSPLLALIVFCHTELSQYCINTLQQKQIDLFSCSLIPAMCCNGSIELFYNVFKCPAKESLNKEWNGFYPIHILSVFHNYELLNKLMTIGINVNEKTDENVGWTPLMLAAGNDTQGYGDYNHEETGRMRRDNTIHHLLRNGANINLCMKKGVSPLYIACQNEHDSTVQLLLSNGADINLCMEDGASPLYIACQNEHDSTVQLLLSNGADINLCMEDGASPLYVACQNGHDRTVQLLLRSGADINLWMEDGARPLYVACQNGHDSTVQLLLRNGADNNLCMEDGASPLYVACQNGHDRTVQLLLRSGADINMRMKNGANINMRMKNGASPLYIACQNGQDSTVQFSLSNGADIYFCMEDGASPLNIACQNGHDSTIQILLRNGADINNMYGELIQSFLCDLSRPEQHKLIDI
eukprot:XP_011439451.2 PREDICTED: uncharacterized protein LOC105336715 isoform X2 [Crassostrea gigas]